MAVLGSKTPYRRQTNTCRNMTRKSKGTGRKVQLSKISAPIQPGITLPANLPSGSVTVVYVAGDVNAPITIGAPPTERKGAPLLERLFALVKCWKLFGCIAPMFLPLSCL